MGLQTRPSGTYVKIRFGLFEPPKTQFNKVGVWESCQKRESAWVPPLNLYMHRFKPCRCKDTVIDVIRCSSVLTWHVWIKLGLGI